ncbi:chemotaxis protein CheW [Hyphomicrobium sulfonivorans]|uniref:Positive regulator of CheA protein activity (CheW) n=1 Tax=Hyphomicrobium sulfonivorans TaxID=121290 RepID=A0A120CU91_HYPSL|nr:chemotaxis protein CheW [Hyphomicrobium sulfonivorans]KWT65850.1 Positive regulator of CheA protein activity (CheW) [Hyphomicrobium sulfonivorans]MBI1648791.1 chemotaxis protein CheW [Hyphomicrobium sulfonivorans]NSL70674.1 chemotaxis protein CheW [Hyphomicrobium sulfonivorans]
MNAFSAALVQEKHTGPARELIAFAVGQQEFCIDVMAVREIRGWTPATVLPHSQSYVRGVINLRGAVLPIIDLAVRLGFPPVDAMGRHVIIVVKVRSQVVGLLVDAVSDILTVTDAEMLPPPDVASDMAKHFVCGLLGIDGRMISILSVENVLPEREDGEAA